MKNDSPEKIFIFKNRALGDAIISLGAVQYLKKCLPNVHIIYGVPQWVYPLFNYLDTSADEIVPINFKTISGWMDSYSLLKNKSPDLIIELFQSGRGRKFGNIWSLLNSHIPYFGNNHHLDDGSYKKSNIQRDIDGINKHFPDLPFGSYLDFCPTIKSKSVQTKKNKIVFGIVATRETKLWPIKNYHALAKVILQNFPDYHIVIPISKNALDQNLKKEFIDFGILDRVNFLETSLENLPQEISTAKLYIGNDTGIKHLSIALGLRSVSFFGPEPPIEWHPYDQMLNSYYYVDGLECRTRDAHFCGLSTCESMICMKEIVDKKVFEDVIAIIKEIS